ncbi:MAG: response regulator [Bernardetiaceae bacterium]|nr:response regulator [Bernardetiaceae bacterium]
MKKQAILCVDDDITILESLKSQLQAKFSKDFTIEIAESAEEALETIDFLSQRKVQTLVIITDWLMPEMKGDEFLIKVAEKYPQISTIMLSGQADKKAIDNAFERTKLSMFIEKPWEKERLLDAVEALTAKH